MGFGTLLFGYFLLLNLTYFGYTDLISGLIMMMALYKLSSVNRDFKNSLCISALFSVFGAAQLIITVISTFMPTFREEDFLLYITPLRYVIIAFLTLYILWGIKSVAKEVGLPDLAKKAGLYAPISVAVFLLTAIFDLPFMSFIPANALAIIAVLLLLSVFVLVLINLFTIHKAYMHICMPEDLTEKEEKKSKIGFVNKFREHEEEKRKEYAEYKISKMQKKSSNQKSKRKKQ